MYVITGCVAMDGINLDNVLPDSRLRDHERSEKVINGHRCIPVFCANCHAPCGYVLKSTEFAFVMCDPCTERLGTVAGVMAMPMELYWAKLAEAQLEERGRLLSPEELYDAVNDSLDPLSKLAKDMAKL